MSIEHATKVLTTNVAKVYKFDLDALAPLAEQHCMTKAEVAEPISYTEITDEAKACPGMSPMNQLVDAS
jgi:hypothetical protein